MVAVPVTADYTEQVMASLTNVGEGSSMATIIRGNNFDRPVYKGDCRVPIIRESYNYLSRCRSNNECSKASERELAEFSLKQRDQETSTEQMTQQGQSVEAQEVVARNRNELDVVHSVFLPDRTFAPGHNNMPVAFLNMKSPYAATMPIFFPNLAGDVDDPRRTRPVTELEWIGHIIRCVHKELTEFPLFAFTAAYRIDMQSLRAAFNSCSGYRQEANGMLKRCDNDGNRLVGTVRGSSEYYSKQRADILAKCNVLGYPALFLTFRNTDLWEVTLATALSQDGRNIWHRYDEEGKLTLLDGQNRPGESEAYYFDHSSDVSHANTNCPYHESCRRVPIDQVLDNDGRKKCLVRNVYNVQRIFDQRATSLFRHIVMSDVNGIGALAYHFVKEFGDVSGWAHAHGVVWLKSDVTRRVLEKMHSGSSVRESEKKSVCDLAHSVVTACLQAEHLCASFPELSELRGDDIVRLASQHQTHDCMANCSVENDSDGCLYHFPRFPTKRTVICSPVEPNVDKDEARYLQSQCRKVKMAVRNVLIGLKANGQLGVTCLTDVLLAALGNIDGQQPTQHGFYNWKDGELFPPSLTLTRWLELMRRDGDPYPALFAVYSTAISTATWHVDGSMVYQLVLRRTVAESYVVDYNPYLLEAMRSNMEVRIVTHTPELVVDYVTKAKDKPSSQRVIQDIQEKGEPVTAARIASRAQDYREVSLAEAFFRIDDTLKMSETNLRVVFASTNFPELRGTMYQRDAGGQFLLPGREGYFKKAEGILSKYMKK